MGANASRHKAMSYGYLNKDIERLQAEIEQLLKQAEQIDAEQDAALGSRRGDELPEELKRREDRLTKIREAKTRLQAEAAVKAEHEQRRRDEEQAQREAEGRKRRGKESAPVDATPEDKAQTNFTDPEAKVMKQSNKGFDYSYNAQAVVDGEEQIIVAAEVTNQANDKRQAVPMALRGPGQPGRGPDRSAPVGGRNAAAASEHGRYRLLQRTSACRFGKDGDRSVHRNGSAKTSRGRSTVGGRRVCARGECQGEDATQTAHRQWQVVVRGCASTSWSRYLARSKRRVASASSCCVAWRRWRPSGN